MKIALLNTYRVIQGRGGAEKVFCELANGFAQCGHEVLGKLFKNPRAKPDGTKMFCSAFLNDARMCCFFANAIVKY